MYKLYISCLSHSHSPQVSPEMAPTLYSLTVSPPARAVLITAKAIGLDLNVKELDFFNDEHLKPDYLKLNPQHTIPTFVDDDGFAIGDSHAIMAYLVSKYAKDDHLYPKDIRKRAVVDQRLHFDSGTAFTKLKPTSFRAARGLKTSLEKEDTEGIPEIYQFLEAFLDQKKWMAGDSVTIADYSLITTIGGLKILLPVEAEKYPKLAAWMRKVEQLPEYEVNKKGQKLYEEMLKTKLNL